ncbi:MAG: hypothetical protein ABIN01_18465, partial [Ferruginibacter sp.]
LTTDLKYLSTQKEQLNQKILKPLASTKEKVDKLSAKMDDTEALGEFIKERKKQLITSSIQYIGKSKYLNKINKEAFYYVETMKNYKEIFSDPKKAEETVKEILSKIPAFQKFAQENSPLSRLFTLSGSFPTLSSGGSVPIVNGLPSRNLVQNLMQANFPLGIPSPLQKLQSLEAKPLLDGLKDSSRAHNKIDDPRVPTFKPNTQRAVPFKKRLEFGSDLEFGKSTNYLPATANIALKIGYKLNDKSSAGMGINYLLGIGRGWNNVRFTNNGIGLRTYLKWKLKKGLDIQGGGEWNHLSFTNFDQLKIVDEWQQSALLGICKSYAIGKKLKGNVQILHDFLYNHHVPVSPPFLFRFGYGF